MAGFVIGCILAVIAFAAAVAAAAAGRANSKSPSDDARMARNWCWAATAVLSVTGVLLVILSMYVGIGTQDVGIVTSFGKPVGTLSNGAHWKAPWEGVTTMDNAVQTDIYEGSDCINIRIADQQTACAKVRIRWQMRQSAADRLFRLYRTNDGVRTSLVTGELGQAMNEQFAVYNPIASLTTTIPEGHAGNPTITQLAAKVTQQMRSEIGSEISVYSVIVPLITYANTVQDRINTVLAQVAQTDVAKQAVQTAKLQAQAADTLRAAVSNDPNVLISRCLDLLNEAVKAGYQLPAGFSCFGGSTTSVLAPSK